MIARRAQAAALVLFRLASARLYRCFPDDSLDDVARLFDAAQHDAFAAGGWRGLIGCWVREGASLATVMRAPARSSRSSLMTDATARSSAFACLRHDVRDAWRALSRTPSFTVIVVATLALGIGVNTAVFSVVDALVFKPLPYSDPDRLVRVAEVHPSGTPNTVAPAVFLDWRTMTRSFSALEARHAGGASLSLVTDGPPVEVLAARVTAGYFDLLGTTPFAGRLFQAGDDAAGSACTTVLSHRLWLNRFEGSPASVGAPIRFADTVCTVIGVLPPDSVFDRSAADVYVPLAVDPATASRRNHFLTVYGRLRPDVSIAQAQAEMQTVAAAIHRANPDQTLEWGATVNAMRDLVVREDSRRLVWVLFGAVGVVLLVACVNVAGLSLSRAANRRREVAVRVSLGAGRWRVVRHLIVESLVLAGAGATIGLVLGAWVLRTTRVIVPPGALPAEALASLDSRALAFTGLTTVATALLTTVLPAWHATRGGVVGALRAGGRGLSGTRAIGRLQGGLLVAEMALATVLVAGAALLVVSFTRLTSVPPGFAPDGLLTFKVSLPDTRYRTAEGVTAFYEQMIDTIGRVGGVESAAAITSLPLGGWLYGATFIVEGVPVDPDRPPSAHIQHVAGPYFETLQIPLVEGRPIQRSDTATAPRVVVVNETFVQRHLGGGPAVGRRLTSVSSGGTDDEPWTIVGVMQNVKTGSLAESDTSTPEIYVSHLQAPMPSMFVAVRARSGDPQALQRDVATAVASVDPLVPLGGVQAMTDRLGRSVTIERFQTAVMTSFAGLALLMACLGVYAVRSQAVAARTREVGIRLALGATRRQVLGLMLSQGARLIGVGLVAGLAIAFVSSRAIERWLFDTAAGDPAGLSLAVALIGASALVASWLPARRASRLDPNVTLQHE